MGAVDAAATSKSQAKGARKQPGRPQLRPPAPTKWIVEGPNKFKRFGIKKAKALRRMRAARSESE